MFAGMGMSLIAAGAVITFIGTRHVFVSTDLEFLRTSVGEMFFQHERLVPLVAHDRASLGGMLTANGIVILLCALWGMRAGERWLWHALAWGGNAGFVAAVGAHDVVGYESLLHLAPAFPGLAIWWQLAPGLCVS